MGRKAEKIGRWAPPRVRKEAKRAVRRARRRLERTEPELAPETLRHVTRGWTD